MKNCCSKYECPGYIYCAEAKNTPGLTKIGLTQNIKQRRDRLDQADYKHIVIDVDENFYAIEVDNMKLYEDMLHKVFSYCRVGDDDPTSELFAVDFNKVKMLMSKLGKQAYPPITEISQKDSFNESYEISNISTLSGYFYLNQRNVKASAHIENGKITILKGSQISLNPVAKFNDGRNKAIVKHYELLIKDKSIIKDGKFICDYFGFNSLSRASSVLLAMSSNGRNDWKTSEGISINTLCFNK